MAILSAIGNGTAHGYDIMKFVQGMGYDVGAATLYRKLHGLVKVGMLAEVATPTGETDPRKRFFQITGEGKKLAKIKVNQLAIFLEVAKQQLKHEGD